MLKAPRIRDYRLMQYLKLNSDECALTGVVHDLHLHHVIFRSQGGDDVKANIVCMTEIAHGAYHAGDPVAKRMLAEHIKEARPDTATYIASKLGPGGCEAWFERHGVDL